MAKKAAAAKRPAKKPVKAKAKATKVVKEKDYSADFEYICLAIEQGQALRNVCKSFMSTKKFFELLDGSEELRKRYARACESRADEIFEDILEIADESNADLTVFEGKLIVNGDAVQRSKLKIEARKWILSKMSPKKYGDKIEVDANVKAEITEKRDYTKLSNEELRSMIELQRKVKALT